MSRPFWWFQGASVDELTRQLSAHPGARLEVHLDANDMTFVVVPEVATETHGGEINESHVCPPSCP